MTIKIKPTDLQVGTTDLKPQWNPPYQITKIISIKKTSQLYCLAASLMYLYKIPQAPQQLSHLHKHFLHLSSKNGFLVIQK